MSRISHLLFAAAIAAATGSQAFAQAGNQNLKPGVGAGKILSAQLGIQSPSTTACPTTALLMAWVTTDFLGSVSIMLARQGQGVVAGPIAVQTQPAVGGKFRATYQKQIQITQPIDTAYRVLAGGGGGVTSNWVPLKASCATGPGPGNVQGNG